MRAAIEPAQALEDAITAAIAAHPLPAGKGIAVAYSGGADSTALLHAASRFAAARAISLHAFHIHHGLAPAADAWLAHCRDEAARLGVGFDAEHVTPTAGGSLEAEARRLRYAALAVLCRRHDAAILLTAHHADDQAETVLLNLARGAGIGGLAATARSRRVDGLAIVRPFIDLPVETLRRHVLDAQLAVVDDPSNHDRRFTRNAIRHEVMPPLRRIAPTIAARLARTATHAASMQALLDEIGAEDLGAMDHAEADLDTERLAALTAARAANALRVWLARRGMRAPSTPALKEMLQQLLHASPDAQIALLHERSTLRLYRGRVSVDHGSMPRAGFRALAWTGEERIDVPEWHGALRFTANASHGVDAAALREGPLAIRPRRGGERLVLRTDGPSRTLKNLYQEAAIPAWQRARLPLVYLGDRLLYAAGLGANAALLGTTSPGVDLVAVEWLPS